MDRGLVGHDELDLAGLGRLLRQRDREPGAHGAVVGRRRGARRDGEGEGHERGRNEDR